MQKFPRDAPKDRVIKALNRLSFEMVRTGNHIALLRKNQDGTITPLTLPNHSTTLRAILNQSGITRLEFLEAYYRR